MKKIFFLLLLFSSILANAQYTYQIVARNLTAADNTTSANIIGSGAAFHNLTWNVSGTVSTCSVRVDGSADGITWGTGDVIGATTCTSNGTTISSSTIKNYVRINLVTLTGAGATFTANLSGYITQPSGGGTLTSLTCGTGITCSPGSPITNTGTISASSTGGAFVQLETHAASTSATLDFTTCLTNSSYHTFHFVLTHVLPATNASNFIMEFGNGVGPTWDNASSHYAYTTLLWNPGGIAVGGTGSSSSQVIVSPNVVSSTASNGGFSGLIDINDPANGTVNPNAEGGIFTYFSGSTLTGGTLNAHYLVATAVTGVRFRYDNGGSGSGNITSGTITCYGITP